MNLAVRAAVDEAIRGRERPVAWSWTNVLLLQDIGPVPALAAPAGDFLWNKGFNLLLLGDDGIPAYFCKVRPAGDASLIRATAVQERLCRSSGRWGGVPWTRGVRTPDAEIQVAEFIPGRRFDRLSAGLGDSAWTVAAGEVLEAAEEVGRRAAVALPELLGSPDSISPAREGEPFLAYLREVGLAPERANALARGLASGGSLPRELQHGDLWPSNVVRHQHAWWLLDFEIFAEVQVPLYDAYLFTRSAALTRSPREEPSPWRGWLSGQGAGSAQFVREIIRRAAARRGVQGGALLSAFIYYVVDMAARLRRRGVPRMFWGSYFEDVEAVADALREGRDLTIAVGGAG